MPIKKKTFNRAKFELAANKHVHTVKEIIEMLAQGRIREDDYLFTLGGMKEIAVEVYRGGWRNCLQQEDTKTDWGGRRAAIVDADKFIVKAFTG